MTKTKWCVIQKTKTKTKSEFAVKINTAHNIKVSCGVDDRLVFQSYLLTSQPTVPSANS